MTREKVHQPAMAELWTLLQEQQDRVAQLEVQLEQRHLEKLAFSGRVGAGEERGGSERPRVSRAGLLKAAAVGVAGLAGAGALSPRDAEAAGTDGDVGLGVTNTTGANSPNMQTTIQAASGMLGSAVFAADAYNGGANSGGIDGVNGQGSGTSSGVFGRGGPSGGVGIFGLGGGTSGTGVVGIAAGGPFPSAGLHAGVYGLSMSNEGVYGSSSAGEGVHGSSSVGYGVRAFSGSSVDLAAAGTGRLLLNPQATAGAPSTGRYNKGELIVDSTGVPYACTSDGAPGTWQAVGNLRSFRASTRVFGDGGVIPAGTTTAAIDATAGSGVPTGATSAYCAVQASASTPGPLTLFPDGADDPGIANYTAIVPNTLNLFYMLVPLSASGKFRIHTYITGQIYVDVWGYLQ
ncbi:MAG: hypothetical protein NVSMB22_17250 [Chloroflexota bacterium]